MLFVVGAIDERDHAIAGERADSVESFRLPAKLGAIPTLEFCPARGIVAEPFTELRAGRNLFHPVTIGSRLAFVPFDLFQRCG